MILSDLSSPTRLSADQMAALSGYVSAQDDLVSHGCFSLHCCVSIEDPVQQVGGCYHPLKGQRRCIRAPTHQIRGMCDVTMPGSFPPTEKEFIVSPWGNKATQSNKIRRSALIKMPEI